MNERLTTNGSQSLMEGERLLRIVTHAMLNYRVMFDDWASGYFAGQISLIDIYGDAPVELIEKAHALRKSLKGTVPYHATKEFKCVPF